MKHLIVYTHLNPKSFTKAVTDEIERVLIDKGDEFKTIDLYGENFNPVLLLPDIKYNFLEGEAPDDVKAHQDLVTWADNLIFTFPVWWASMPAILKGYIDRVFTKGYAYNYLESGKAVPLLTGKSAQLFMCAGAPEDGLKALGYYDGMNEALLKGIFEYCGLKSDITLFDGMSVYGHDKRVEYLNSIQEKLQ
ncbi:NAD(P)H-dependent oxidoreductase [Pseudovibrio denitrificans]|uniref:NAD(P)H-dependent oxidoreductase n=1 Tax=Pseudovibrio denitrificans TaxID=258256 RepID=UPI0039BEE731